MSSQRLVVGFAILLCLFVVWKILHPTHSYRYRLTIEVEKDGALHSGSSVVELNTQRLFFLSALPHVPDWRTHYRGEAVFVDLGDGDHLVALLGGTNAGRNAKTASFPSRIILGDKMANTTSSGVLDALATKYPDRLTDAKGKSYPVGIEQMPPLIRFRQIDDPMTVESVDPANLAASFGPGVMLRGAHLEITRDPITKSIDQRLPWLNGLKPGKALSGRNGSSWRAGELPYSTPNQITYWMFVGE